MASACAWLLRKTAQSETHHRPPWFRFKALILWTAWYGGQGLRGPCLGLQFCPLVVTLLFGLSPKFSSDIR